MEQGVLWNGLISINMISLIETLRMVLGPLNKNICLFQCFFRNGPTISSLLFMNAIAIFRVRIYFNKTNTELRD